MHCASPLSAQDFSHLTPAFILVCELDSLRDEGIMYAQMLMQVKVTFELQVISIAIHLVNLFPSKLSDDFYASHHQLNLAMEKAYRSKPFRNDDE